MSELDPGSVATTYVHAWTTGDFATARSLLRDDVTFVGPLGTTDGAEDAMAGLQRMSEMVKGVDQKQVIVDGGDVCVVYDLLTESAGAIPTAGWYHVRDGRIDAIQAFFDPRPLLAGRG